MLTLAGALALLVLGIVPIRSAYTAIDWPVVVLLGAMLPVANVTASTGTADVIAGLVVVLVITMFLSDVMNNAAVHDPRVQVGAYQPARHQCVGRVSSLIVVRCVTLAFCHFRIPCENDFSGY